MTTIHPCSPLTMTKNSEVEEAYSFRHAMRAIVGDILVPIETIGHDY